MDVNDYNMAMALRKKADVEIFRTWFRGGLLIGSAVVFCGEEDADLLILILR